MIEAARPKPRLTIAQGMTFVAACAVVCAYPALLMLVVLGALVVLGERLNWPFLSVASALAMFWIAMTLLVSSATVARGGGPLPFAHAPDRNPVRLTDDGQEKARPMWSPDGKTLTFARHESGGTRIIQYLMDPSDPKSLRRLTDRKPPEFHAAFLPDGKRLLIATVELSGTQGNVDISLIQSDGTGLKRVVGDLSGKLSHQDWPSPSPDGQRFAFSSTHEGNQEIYAAKIDGTDVVRLTQSPGHDAHPAWSPKGDRIAFSTDRWGGLEIATVKPDGTGLSRITQSRGIDDFPAFSPDGSRLAFVSHRDGQSEIYVCNADGTNPIRVSNSPGRDTQPSWTPDGSGITFVSDREGGIDLFTVKIPPREEAPR